MVRNANGDALKVDAERACALTVDRVELVAVLRGLEIALIEGWPRGMFEIDCLKVSSWIAGEGQTDLWMIQLVLQDILRLILLCWILWVGRELNKVADRLAKFCINSEVEVCHVVDVPSSVWQVVMCKRAALYISTVSV